MDTQKVISLRQLFFLLLSCVSLCCHAQVSLDSCRLWAQRNYPAVRQYELIQRSAEFNISNAARSWIPKIAISAQGTWQSDVIDMADVWSTIGLSNMFDLPDMKMQPWQGKVQIDLMQPIWDGGKASADKRQAEAERREQVAQTDVEFYQLDKRVMELYFGILLLDEQRQQLEATDSLLQNNLKRVNTLFSSGVVLKSDVDAIRAEQLSLNQKREQLNHSCTAFKQMLSLLVGRDVTNDKLQTPEQIEPRQNLRERPELQVLNAKSGLLVAQRKNILSYTMPQFYAFAQGWYGYPGLNMFDAMTSSKWTPNAVVGMRMQWNIGAYYTLNNRLNQLKVAEQQINVQRDIFEFNRRMQIVEENSEITRLRKVIEDDDQIVELRKSIREASEVKFENGTITTGELLQKITDEDRANSTRSLHQVELLKAIYQLQHIQ